MNDRPRILVVGLGGIGGIMAGHLATDGHDVTVVVRSPDTRSVVEQRGLRVEGDLTLGDVFFPKVVASPADVSEGAFDFVVLATQPPSVEAAARSAVPALAPTGAAVIVQNGLCEDRIAPIVGDERVIGAIVAWGASTAGPGHVVRTATGGFTIGRPRAPCDDACRVLAAMLASTGPVALTDNLVGARWTKLAFNCAVSTLGTVGGDRLGALIGYGFVRRLGLEVMTEVVHVAKAQGVRLEPLAKTIDLERLALTEAERKNRARLALARKHALMLAAGVRYRRLRSSMLAAIERGQPPAIDFLNGEIVGRAAGCGLEVPVNDALRRAVHDIAAGRRRSGIETLRAIYQETRRSV